MKDSIILEGVSRSFGDRKVLRGVSARARAGTVIGLLGRNGEGKTTLFKIMLDMLAADAGSIELSGSRPDGTGAIRRKIGFVPERPAFHEFMKLGEVLDIRRSFFPSWETDRAEQLARRLGLDLAAGVRGASKGTLGKLAWVCAAAHNPSLFLLDEPTSGLDALIREEILGHLIEELHGTGKTILVASHHLEELSGLLDEVWVLENGGIASVRRMETLRTQAVLLRGRALRPARAEDFSAISLPGEGPLVNWAALDRASADKIAQAGLIENMERSPLPIETTLRLLLKGSGGDHGA